MSKRTRLSDDLTDSNTHLNGQVEQLLVGYLDSQVDSLDHTVTSRLSAIRHKALADDTAASQNSFVQAPFRYRSALVGASICLIVALLGVKLYAPFYNSQHEEQGVGLAKLISDDAGLLLEPTTSSGALAQGHDNTDLLQDLTMLSASDDLEFYQSIELLEWLEANAT